MRLILFFDLPMVTKADVRIYTHFHKYLVQEGYFMMQYSIYCKLFPNREAAVKHVDILKRNVPVEGHVRVTIGKSKNKIKRIKLYIITDIAIRIFIVINTIFLNTF